MSSSRCSCFPRRKPRFKLAQNNNEPHSIIKASVSNEDWIDGRKQSTDLDLSIKDAVSQSAESQNYGGSVDNASASLGGWSNIQPTTTTSPNVSNVNLVPSETSSLLLQSLAVSLLDQNKLSEEYAGRLEALISRLENLAGLKHTGPTSPAGLAAFKAVCNETLPRYLVLSAELDQNLNRQARRVAQAFRLVSDLIEMSTKYSKPKPALMDEYLRPLSYKFMEIADFDPDVDPITRHELRTVAESVLALAWCNCPTASPFVKEIRDAANAYANKAFQSSLANRQKHADWVRAWMACLQGVQDVVDSHFRFGLSWVPNGPDPPMPLKPYPPCLKFERIEKSTLEKPISPKKTVSLNTSAPSDLSGDGDWHAKLLLELARRRSQLRHVQPPELI